MSKSYTENHNWKDNPAHVLSLFELVVSHIDKYDRQKWPLKNKCTPNDWTTLESNDALTNIVENLIIKYDDDTFSTNGCDMVIRNAISILDGRDASDDMKTLARLSALEAGFISEDDLNYIEMMDDKNNTLNFKIVNNQLTPEQLFEHLNNPLAENVLTFQYPKYKKSQAFKAVLDFNNLTLKDIPKKYKNLAAKEMKTEDNAYTQLTKAKQIIEQFIKQS